MSDKKDRQSNMREFLAWAASTTASKPEKKAYETKFNLLAYQYPEGAIGYSSKDLVSIYKRDLLQLSLVTMAYHGYNKKLSDLTDLFPAKHVLKLNKKYKTELRSISFEILDVKQARNLLFHEVNFLKKKLKRTFSLIEQNDEVDSILLENLSSDSMMELAGDLFKEYLDWQPYSIETFTGKVNEELSWEDVEAFDKLLGLDGKYVSYGEAGSPFAAIGGNIDVTERLATKEPSATMKGEIDSWFEKEFNETLAEEDDLSEAPKDDYDTIAQKDLENHIKLVRKSKKRFIK